MALLFPAGYQFFDDNGDPVESGTVTFYDNFTTNSAEIYIDPDLAVQASNPFPLDSAGRLYVNLYGAGDYTVILKNGSGASIWSYDNVFGWTDGSDAPTLAGNNAMTGNNTFSGTNTFTGTVNIGANNSLAEYIADTVGAMVTGNTETNIAVTYDDADNTLDFVVPAASNAETLAGTEAAKFVTPAGLQYRINPAGVIYRNTTQVITLAGGKTKLQFNTVDFNGCLRGTFDTTTNYRYTATEACRVLVIARATFSAFTSAVYVDLTLERNGSIIGYAQERNDSSGGSYKRSLQISRIVSLTAGQYLEVYAQQGAGTDITLQAGVDDNSLEILELN